MENMKKSILIHRIKEIIAYEHIESIFESFVTRLQRCIKLEGDRTYYSLFNQLFIQLLIFLYKKY